MPSNGSCTASHPRDRHPQLEIITAELSVGENRPFKHVEYRVYNWRRLGSGRVVRGDGWGLGDAVILGLLVYMAVRVSDLLSTGEHDYKDVAYVILLVLAALLYLRSCMNAILYQSVVPLPNLGLQLSTTRGISLPHPIHPRTPESRLLVAISTSYEFIPLSKISTIVINEGLKRWNVRHYLAVVKRRGGGVVIALDEVWAPVAVLKEVYHGLRESLFDEFSDAP